MICQILPDNIRAIERTNLEPAGPVPVTDVPYYRLTVGNRTRYDLMGATQFALLFALGLRESHTVCDVGCGSLRAGRLLIPYLEADRYCGIEPRTDVLEAGL